jgi:hypothetical protein
MYRSRNSPEREGRESDEAVIVVCGGDIQMNANAYEVPSMYEDGGHDGTTRPA